MKRVLGLVAVVVVLQGLAAYGAVPTLINYQGRLMDSSGKPVNDTKTMAFEFHSVPTGGTPLGGFSESQEVSVTDGVFNVLIGSTVGGVPAAIFDYPEVYLHVEVDGQVLTPSHRVTSVAYAIKAAKAEQADSALEADHAANADDAVEADRLDGVHAGQFVRSDVADAKSGDLTLNDDLDVTCGTIRNVGGILGCGLGGAFIFSDGIEMAQPNSGGAYGFRVKQYKSTNYGNLFVDDDGFHLTNNGIDPKSGLTISGDDVTAAWSLNAPRVTSSLELSGRQATFTHGVQVATSGLGALRVGPVEQTLYNQDVGCNNLHADRSLYLGSSRGNGNIYAKNSIGDTTLQYDASNALLSVGGSDSPGQLVLEDGAASTSIGLYGAGGDGEFNGSVKASEGLEGQGVNGLFVLPDPIPAVPGVKGIGTAGSLLLFGAPGVVAVGGNGDPAEFGADIAFRSEGRLQFLNHSNQGVDLIPGDGTATNPLDIALRGGTGTAKPTVRISDGLEVYRNVGGGAIGCAIRAENDASNGIAFTGRVTSTDSCAVLINKYVPDAGDPVGTADLIRGFSGASGGNLVFEVFNNGYVRSAAVYTGPPGTAPPTVHACGVNFGTGSGDITAVADLMSGDDLVVGANAYVDGNMYVSGAKNAVVNTESYGMRKVYAEESAEVHLFDRGCGKLVGGSAKIELDPVFLETVTIDDDHPMIVFASPMGQCNGLYIAETTAGSFVVKELAGGRSAASFTWEVAAKRKGYENVRLAQPAIMK